MRLLFYINQFSNDILNAFLIFLNRILLESVDTEIVVICESELYKSALEKLNTNKNLINVINVYELLQNKMLVSVSDNSRSRKYTKLIFPKHYSNIEKQRVFDDKAVYDLYIVVQNILDEYDIKAVCYCNCMLAVFRSVGLLILHDIVQNLNLPFYWIAKSPIKGRFTVYDSLYYDHKKIDDDYKILLKNSAMYSTVKMETFFKSYLDFKTNVQMPIFEQISKKRQISKIILDCLNKMMLICNHAIRIQNKNLNFERRNPDRPYILYLLTKINHWYTSYANSDLLDRANIISNVWRSIPSGFDLVLKKHPRMEFDKEIESVAYGLSHCYLGDNISTIQLVENASIVIFSGTTSGVEALIQHKHVIEIGKRSIGFSMDSPPLKRITNLLDLSEKISECLKEEPPSDKIYAFFESLLKNSYPYINDSEGMTLERNENTFIKMANTLMDRIVEDHTTNYSK